MSVGGGLFGRGLNRLKKELDILFEEQGSRGLKVPLASKTPMWRYCSTVRPIIPTGFSEKTLQPKKTIPRRPGQGLETPGDAVQQPAHVHQLRLVFDEISGLETRRKYLRIACRAIQLARDLRPGPGAPARFSFVSGPSNLEEYRDGRGVWERLIRPSAVDLDQFWPTRPSPRCIRTQENGPRSIATIWKIPTGWCSAKTAPQLAIGRLQVHSGLTGEEQEMIYAILHFGGPDFFCRLKAYQTPEDSKPLRPVLELYQTASVGEVYDRIREFSGGQHCSLKDLFLEERRHLIDLILKGRLES